MLHRNIRFFRFFRQQQQPTYIESIQPHNTYRTTIGRISIITLWTTIIFMFGSPKD